MTTLLVQVPAATQVPGIRPLLRSRQHSMPFPEQPTLPSGTQVAAALLSSLSVIGVVESSLASGVEGVTGFDDDEEPHATTTAAKAALTVKSTLRFCIRLRPSSEAHATLRRDHRQTQA